MDVEGLQDGALGDDIVNVPILHGDAANAELLEMGEGGAAWQSCHAGELPEADIEACEGGDGEERGREGHVEQPRGGSRGPAPGRPWRRGAGASTRAGAGARSYGCR